MGGRINPGKGTRAQLLTAQHTHLWSIYMHDAYDGEPLQLVCERFVIHEPDDANSGGIHCTFPSFGSSTPRDTRPWEALGICEETKRWLLKVMARAIRQPGDRGALGMGHGMRCPVRCLLPLLTCMAMAFLSQLEHCAVLPRRNMPSSSGLF